jgi:hypothetical protein
MRKRKAEGAQSRVEAGQPGRVRLQPAPRGPGSDDGSAASPNRLAPGVVGASRQADAVHAANPDGGTVVVSVHVDTGRCSRTAGRGRSTPSPRQTSCLAFESTPFYARVSIGREEAFRERADWTTRRGLASSSGAGERALRPRAPPGGAFSCPPTPKAGWSRSRSTSPDSGYASIDLLAWPSPPATGAPLPRGHDFSQQRR